MAFLEAFLIPLLWVLGLGLGLIVVGTAAFLLYCWFRSLAQGGQGSGDGAEGDS